MTRVKKAIYLLFLLLAVACLDEPDCFNLTNDTVTIVFRKMFDGRVDTVTFARVDVTGTQLTVFDEDTVVLTNLSVLVDYTATSSLIKVKTFERITDIELGYRVQGQFVSESCGPKFLLSELKVLNSNADSIAIANATPGAGGNVNVYRCPRTNYLLLAFRELEDGELRRDTLTLAEKTADFNYTKLYAYSGALSFIRLTLNLASNATTHTFEFEDGETKFITFNYSRADKMILPSCGVQTVIDDIRIVNSNFSRSELIIDTRLKRDSIYDPPIINFQVVR
jgi:hypothetical protein